MCHQYIVSTILPFVHSIWLAGTILAAGLARLIVSISRKMPVLAKFIDEKRIEKEPITLLGELAIGVLVIVAIFL